MILLGKLLDRFGKRRFVFLSIAVFVLGLVLLFFAQSIGVFALLACVMFCGYGLLMIIFNATVRDFTPEDKVGQFQGVRMIFAVLIPMIAGPYTGSWMTELFAARHDLGTYLNDYAETVLVPVPEIFLAAAVICALVCIPTVFVRRRMR